MFNIIDSIITVILFFLSNLQKITAKKLSRECEMYPRKFHYHQIQLIAHQTGGQLHLLTRKM